jgi:surface protein
MKTKFMLGTGLVLTSLLVSCSSEDLLQGGKPENANTLRAYIEKQSDSRVTINDEGIFAWSNDDAISVQLGSAFSTWTLSSINEDGSADFSSDCEAEDGAYAIYPNTVEAKVSTNDELQVTLPASYDTNKTAPILTGKYQDGKVEFAHAGALIRISFENVPSFVDNFVFSTNDQNITGDFTVDDEKAINVADDENNTVTINFTEEDIKDGGITFDIPVPVGTYNGFKASLRYGENEIYTKSTTEDKTYTIERRDLVVMPTEEVPTMNYVIEKVKVPEGYTKAQFLGGEDVMMLPDGQEETQEKINPSAYFDLAQVKSMYIDKVLQENPIRSYAFNDTDEHTVVIILNDDFTTAKNMFKYSLGVTSFDFSHFNTSGIKDMNSMFMYCYYLEKLDLSGIDTRDVTDMSSMFNGCRSLTSLDVSEFVTDNVTSMHSMFHCCSSLTTLNLSNFKTDNVTSMAYMFGGCSGLTSIDLSSFNTEKVTSMSYMFEGCSSLESIDLSNFKTPSLADMGWTFGYCKSLKSIDLSSFDTSGVSVMYYLFSNASNLTTIKMTGALNSSGDYYAAFNELPDKGEIYYPKAYATEYETLLFQSYLTNWDKYLLDENGKVIEDPDTDTDNSTDTSDNTPGYEVDSVED